MQARRPVAFLIVAALVAVTAGDLLAARNGSCGPHACCAHGTCTMMAKSGGARLDRCPSDDRQMPPALVPAPAPLTVAPRIEPAPATPVFSAPDSPSFDIDRPPRA
jgi:hypothetical protein